jgi:hypothetical protein
MHQLGFVFQIILLVAIAAGAFVSWDRRTDEDPQDSKEPTSS